MLQLNEWQEIKEYFNYTDNASFVARKTGKSPTTTNKVRKSVSYEDYKKLVTEESKTKKEKQEEKPEEKTALSNAYKDNRVYEQLKEQNEKLALILQYERERTRLVDEILKILKD